MKRPRQPRPRNPIARALRGLGPGAPVSVNARPKRLPRRRKDKTHARRLDLD